MAESAIDILCILQSNAVLHMIIAGMHACVHFKADAASCPFLMRSTTPIGSPIGLGYKPIHKSDFFTVEAISC